MGEGIFGIEAASRSYYGKPASNLSPEEASRLASVLPNPRKYNPLGTSRYVAKRSALIYNIMVKRGIVIPQYEEVMTTPATKRLPMKHRQHRPLGMKQLYRQSAQSRNHTTDLEERADLSN